MSLRSRRQKGQSMVRFCVMIALIALIAVGSVFAGGEKEEKKKGTIAISWYSLANEIDKQLIAYSTKVLENEGYEVITHDPQGDTNAQVRDWEAWITSGEIDALYYYILNPSIGETTLMKAHAAGIKLISPEPVEASYVDNCLAEDNYNVGYIVGKACGEWMAERFNGERKKVVVVTTEMEIHNTRANGAMDAIKELYPNVEFIRHQGSGQIEFAYNEMSNILTAHPDAKIVVHYAGDSYGCYQAMLDAGMDPKDPDAGIFNLLILNSTIPLLEEENSVFRAAFGYTYVDTAMAVASLCLNAVEGGQDVPIYITWLNPPAEDVFKYFWIGDTLEGESRDIISVPVLKPYRLDENGRWVNPNPPDLYPYLSPPNVPKEIWGKLPQQWRNNLEKYVK